MIEILLILLAVLGFSQAAFQYWNYHRVRHLLRSGGWSVRHDTYGGTTSIWCYSHKTSPTSFYRNWSLSEAYERQCSLDLAGRLDLPEPKEKNK